MIVMAALGTTSVTSKINYLANKLEFTQSAQWSSPSFVVTNPLLISHISSVNTLKTKDKLPRQCKRLASSWNDERWVYSGSATCSTGSLEDGMGQLRLVDSAQKADGLPLISWRPRKDSWRLAPCSCACSGLDEPSVESANGMTPPEWEEGKEFSEESESSSGGVALALAVLRFYKREISPLLPGSCRYVPTCSEYAMEAYRRYGAAKGTALTAWRLLRCNPFGGSGFDPPRWFDEPRPPPY